MRHAALTSALQLFDKDSLSKPSPNQHCSSLLTHLLGSLGNALPVCVCGGNLTCMPVMTIAVKSQAVVFEDLEETVKIELHAQV